MKTILFVIDPQNDFCDPNGSLYVPGADTDMSRLADMITDAGDKIDSIILTADDHLPNDIAHPRFWTDASGNMVEPFTQITAQDVESGKYIPTGGPRDKALDYLSKLEQAGKQHTIWPMHCISGSWGADIDGTIMSALMSWTGDTSRHYRIVRKGYYPYSEHYGAFAAEIPCPDDPSTTYNKQLEKELDNYDQILIAGEAKSHCVKNTIAQLMAANKDIMRKVVILADAMSPVAGFESEANNTFESAKELGARICLTSDFANCK